MRPFTIKTEADKIHITSYGSTMGKTFENIAKGIFAHINNEEDPDPVGQYTVNLSGKSTNDLLKKWIHTLFYLHSHHDLIFHYFKVSINDNQLNGQIFGKKHTPQLGASITLSSVIEDSISLSEQKTIKATVSFTA